VSRTCVATLFLASLLSGPADAATQATPSAPPKVDLDRFDASRTSVALPNGQQLAYVQMGNPVGRPVILVHGFTDNARDWVPLVPYLDPSWRLILVDLRGHGQSSKPECCYHRLDFAYDLKLLMDALNIRKADIVGHSLGSVVCQTFAEEWPDRVGRVVLISSTGGPRPGSPARKPTFDFASEIRKLKEPIDPDSPFMVEWWASPKPVDPDFIRRQRKDAAGIPLRVWLAILDQDVLGADVQRTLPKLKAPTLLIWGALDPLIDEEHRQTLREALPAAAVKVFPGLGHNPFWEEPANVATRINRFLVTGD
jgi:pimeloyl-ACP methyl ester carboxylesterase